VRKNEGIRLQLFMARSGVASRRACEKLIQEGRVAVNGVVVTQLGTRVTHGDEVAVDGRRITPEVNLVYVALHKPRRYVCSESDPEGRPLAGDLLRPYFSERLFSIGRLDFLSSGLILYTNDGEFARSVSHPSLAVEKEYRVETQQPIPEELLRNYRDGITIDGEVYRLKSYRYRGPRSVQLVLTEGKNREIRRVFASHHIGVRRIHRVRIGIVRLKGIPAGQYRPLSRKEIDWFTRGRPTGGPGRQ
jgi:23S rRNA pseudouridine2605 synthase